VIFHYKHQATGTYTETGNSHGERESYKGARNHAEKERSNAGGDRDPEVVLGWETVVEYLDCSRIVYGWCFVALSFGHFEREGFAYVGSSSEFSNRDTHCIGVFVL
jgi:hypothetical protein